ncbi:MAG: trimeric intracellular cation channel family protein [Nitrososphaeria archaeon]|jgi:uncharacterized membrane protein YeiH
MITPYFILLLNYIGIISFSISGALKAGDKDMDLFGFIVLGYSTALAGGIMRDLLIGRIPPQNITYLPYQLAAILTAVAMFAIYDRLDRHRDFFLYPDAIGLGTFAAVGAQIAMSKGFNILGVMAMASITAAGGGVVRDLLAAEIPQILRKEIYATAAAFGGLIYEGLYYLAGTDTALLGTALIVAGIRIVSLYFGLELPHIRTRPSRSAQ